MTVPGMTLTLFDLDGFKVYNDTFGHQAGDALLTRLGRRLRDAVSEEGVAYRLGGDEFCILVSGPNADATRVAAVEALTEHGDAFSIGSSHGSVLLLTEVGDAGQGVAAGRPAHVRLQERGPDVREPAEH